MGKYKVADLSSLSGANLIGGPEVNSRVNPSINNFLNTFTKRVPLSRDTRNCGGDRQVWIVSEDKLHHRGNGRAIC